MIETRYLIMTLYQRSQPGKLTVTINEVSKGQAEIILESLIPQYVCVFDLQTRSYHTYDLTSNKGIVTIKESYPWYDGDYNAFTTYIWNIIDHNRAQLYTSIFPFRKPVSAFLPGQGLVIKISTIQDISGIYVSSPSYGCSWLGVYNNNNNTKFLISSSGELIQELKPKTMLKIKSKVPLDGLIIRDSIKPHSISYNDLSEAERETYMPKEIASRLTSQINAFSIITDWVAINDHIYHGTLTYVPSNEKDFQMMDDHAGRYRYGIEHFKCFIPLLSDGKVCGSFKYEGRAGNRIVKYILVPFKTGDNDLTLCDSDSEVEEEEAEEVEEEAEEAEEAEEVELKYD